MPEPIKTTVTLLVDRVTYKFVADADGDGIARKTPSVPAARPGELTTRTDANTGTLTLETGHGVTTGATNGLNVYWDGGSRTGMTVGTVSGDSVPVDGGAGDDLPALNTDVTAMVPVTESLEFTGDNAVGIVLSSPVAGHVHLFDDGDAEVPGSPFAVGPDAAFVWSEGRGTDNPAAGAEIAGARFSHGDSTRARTMTALAVII